MMNFAYKNKFSLALSLIGIMTISPICAAEKSQKSSATKKTESTMKKESPKTANVVTTASGLQYIDVKEGTGATPKRGQQVVVHYTGTLKDGTKFDSSVDRGQPFSFQIGVGQVIPGWDEGVGSMKVGGKRTLIIPAKLGYGERGVGNIIPPNSELHFDVELLDVK